MLLFEKRGCLVPKLRKDRGILRHLGWRGRYQHPQKLAKLASTASCILAGGPSLRQLADFLEIELPGSLVEVLTCHGPSPSSCFVAGNIHRIRTRAPSRNRQICALARRLVCLHQPRPSGTSIAKGKVVGRDWDYCSHTLVSDGGDDPCNGASGCCLIPRRNDLGSAAGRVLRDSNGLSRHRANGGPTPDGTGSPAFRILRIRHLPVVEPAGAGLRSVPG
jgi:hypothetical protein